MKVCFSPAAAADLEAIGDYIARDDPGRAVTFIREVREHCERLGHMPYAHPVRDDIAPAIRMAVHGHFLMFYHVGEDTVRIERVMHHARKT